MGHHFLPKNLYLKPFRYSKSNPSIWVHERGRAPDHRHWDHIATINDLHTIKKNSGEKDISLESYLNEYEIALAPIVENVIENIGDEKLSLEERQKFSLFIGMMYVRTPRYFEQNKQLASRLKLATDAALSGNKKPFLGLLKETKTDSDKFFKSVDIKNVADWIGNPEVYNHFHLILLQGHANAFAKVLFEQMRWTFIVPEQGVELVTSDNPVSICRITPSGMRDVYAIGRNDAEVYFPISPYLCFHAYHDTTLDKRWSALTMQTEKKYIDNINLRTVAFSQRYAYSYSNIDLQNFFEAEDLVANQVGI